MTVAELMEQLQKMPQNAEVFVAARNQDILICKSAYQVSSNEEYELNRDELIVWIEG